jgi:GH15 family glucan-1,4-alpha-glucosidase
VTGPAPIEDYAILGDTRTSALVSSSGSIDWLCFPRPESEPLFGRLVGGDRGGAFTVAVPGARLADRRYVEGTAVVRTRRRLGPAEVTTTEGMVLDARGTLSPQALLVRRIDCSGGEATIRVCFDPRVGWSGHPVVARRRHGALLGGRGRFAFALTASGGAAIRPGEELLVALRDGDRFVLSLALSDGAPAVLVDPDEAVRRLAETAGWWRSWWSDLEVGPIAEDAVRRSLLTLRLLTYAPSGAPVAAPTTSLPEIPGGDANWDYRFAWVRDAGLGIGAFVGCGRLEEAGAFLSWMLHAGRLTRPRLHVAYDVLGRTSTTRERELSDLPGYEGARPVRVGNEAVDQFQLDVYGWMIDAAATFADAGGELVRETRRSMWGHADVLAERWAEPDHGIWELRGGRRHYVHSKAMAWTGLDRAIRLAGRFRVRERRLGRWAAERDRIHRDLRERGFDERRGSYVQHYGGEDLDAATLLLGVYGVERPDDPRMLGTIDAVRRELGAGGPLVYRFAPRGEGAFLPCSFWLAQALAAAGRRDEAADVFTSACGLATPLGLFAEEMEPGSRRHLGNVPQALTHAALVHAALALR